MQRCTLHGETVALTRTCPGCDASPGVPPSEVIATLPPPPGGCVTSEEHERCLVTAIAEVDALLAMVMPEPDFRITDTHLINSLAKLMEVRVKTRRAAAELARAREDDELVAARDRLMNARAKGPGH